MRVGRRCEGNRPGSERVHYARGLLHQLGNQEAFAEKIIFGYNMADGTMVFRPYNLVTRVQIAVMIVRGAAAAGITLAAPDATDTFTDIGGLPASAQLAIRTCAANAIVSGYANADGSFSFKPYNNATRGQAAVMLFRLMAKMTT